MTNPTGLSILIPTYNYDVRKLIQQLQEQLLVLTVPAEILCYDDASPSEAIKLVNRDIRKLSFVMYAELHTNLGRAAIRNKLASDANYNKLLFIDCDSELVSNIFLKNYLEQSGKYHALVGGTVYNETNSNPEYSLRWTYGKAREQRAAKERNNCPYESLTLNNFFIDRDTFLTIKLDEKIEGYGHEDTKFGYTLQKNTISLRHIDNPVLHCGLETNEVYLEKTEAAIKNFYKLSLQGYGRGTRLFKSYKLLKTLRLARLYRFVFSAFRKSIIRNLSSLHPSLLLFDLYKLRLLLEEEK